MAHKALFLPASKSKPADTHNEANGRAYAFSPEHALAQYAATGAFNQTFYAHEVDRLQKVLDLASLVDPEIVGSEPSLKDVIKMVRPSPKLANGELDAVREAPALRRTFLGN